MPSVRRALSAAVGLVATVAVVGAAGAHASSKIHVEDVWPTFSPDGKRILFARTRTTSDPRNGECCIVLRSSLYVMSRNGTGMRRLPGSGHDSDPAWSPDGKRIVFTRRDRLYVMNADGSGARALRGDYLEHRAPAWSADGAEIAFWRGRRGRGSIFVIRPDGSGLRRVARGADPYGGASWSPDSRKLAFGHNLDVFVVDRDGSDLHALTGGGYPAAHYEPAFSPDGRRLALRSDAGVYVLRSDGTGLHRITRTPNELQQDQHPMWSPDGRTIVFSGYRGHSQESRIYVVDADGRNLRRLTRHP